VGELWHLYLTSSAFLTLYPFPQGPHSFPESSPFGVAILSCFANASIVQFWPHSLGQATPGEGSLRGRRLKRKGKGVLGVRK